MANKRPIVLYDQPDPTILDALARVQQVCLGIVMLIAVVTLSCWILTSLGFVLPSGWTLMKANTALLALASASSLMLSQPHRSRRSLFISRVLAVAVGIVAVLSLVEHAFGIKSRLDTLIAPDASSYHPGLMSPQAGASFAMLAIVLFFIRAENGTKRFVADSFIVSVSLLTMIVVSGYIFGAASLFSVSPSNWTSPQALVALILLSFVAFARRAEYGAFTILVRGGIGSRIARALTPIVLVLPFLRELGRLRLIHFKWLPEHYATAILASAAAMLSFGLLMILAWRINGMEKEIHDLSLRDELTGLYNLRGFQLLAGQALALARRSKMPFSVLFIDLDNLKQINDRLGHPVGSAFLAETASLLKSKFRDTDVVGRIGGDEFAVAGQLSDTAISALVERFERNSALANRETIQRMPLSFSFGHATAEDGSRETLQELLARADSAMYEQKRKKKLRTGQNVSA